MPRKQATSPIRPRYYCGADIPMRVIRRYARQIAEKFQPEKIILFGSYAYGTPHEDSDVDLLVVMPARNELDQSYRIRSALDAPFPLDLVVRTPHNMKWRIEAGDWFLREVTSLGKTIYGGSSSRWASQVRQECRTLLGIRPKPPTRKSP